MNHEDFRPSCTTKPTGTGTESFNPLYSAVCNAMRTAHRFTDSASFFGRESAWQSFQKIVTEARDVWEDRKRRALPQRHFVFDVPMLDRLLRKYFANLTWIVNTDDADFKNSPSFEKQERDLLVEVEEFENGLSAAERAANAHKDRHVDQARGHRGSPDRSKKKLSDNADSEGPENGYRLRESLWGLELPNEDSRSVKNGGRPQKRLIQFPTRESYELFEALWKNRPNAVNVRGHTGSEPFCAINDLRDFLREAGARDLAERLKKRSDAGYCLDLPPTGLIEPAAGVATPNPNEKRADDPAAPSVDDAAFLTVRKLAEMFGVSAEALRKRLERWRGANGDGWMEDDEAASRAARFLYRYGAVKHVIEELRASGERPATTRPRQARP